MDGTSQNLIVEGEFRAFLIEVSILKWLDVRRDPTHLNSIYLCDAIYSLPQLKNWKYLINYFLIKYLINQHTIFLHKNYKLP